MAEQVEVVIIGGGQAGLALSYYLTQQGQAHLVLEQGRVGEVWRSGRWDSFTLNTPNWMTQLPGFPYQDDDPDGFLPREDIVAYLEQYAASFHAPLQCGIRVTAVQHKPDGNGYLVEAEERMFETRNVVLATGAYPKPKLPTVSAALSPDICQLHTSEYRNPQVLPSGAILVVGTGQSGCQIAEDLYESGGRSICPLQAVGELRAAIVAGTSPGGSPAWDFSTEPLISFPHPMRSSRVIPMCQIPMGTASTCTNLPGKE